MPDQQDRESSGAASGPTGRHPSTSSPNVHGTSPSGTPPLGAPPPRRSLWQRLRGLVFGIGGMGFIVGILFWGGFNWAMEATNQESFCISCHEMRDNVYVEYRNTIHFANRSGVRATCPDCHVPKEWNHKIVRKIYASNELLHKVLGSIDTPEKFNAKRLTMAQREWARMKRTDSRECRNCHDYSSFDYGEQGRRSSAAHQKGFQEGRTCIDCHKGIAHSLPPIQQDVGGARDGVSPDQFHPPARTPGGGADPTRGGARQPGA